MNRDSRVSGPGSAFGPGSSDRDAGGGARRGRGAALRIAGLYIGVSLLYIVTSDRIVAAVAPSQSQNAVFQTIKGSGFVLLTGVMLWYLIRRNMSELHRLNESLARQGGRLRILLDDAPIAICLVRRGVLEYLNTAARAMLGPNQELTGTRLLDRVAEPSRAAVQRAVEDVERSGRPARLNEQKLVDTNGREIDVELAACPFAPDEGAVQVAIIDVTERKRLEAGLTQAHKMEAVGKLASGVSHEFNNLLTAILGYSTLARQGLARGAPTTRCLDQIDSVAKHAAGITRSLLTLSRASPALKQLLPLRPIVDEAIDLVRSVVPKTIQLEVATTLPEGASVLVDAAQLKQAILNLAMNARDAMPAGGTLWIRTSFTADHGPGLPHGAAVIRVSDTGVGIPPEVRARLFTPFFTTKPAGKGTGLGLALTRSIIEDHGGSIHVESEVGKGSAFTVSLPCTSPGQPAAAPPTRAGQHVVIVGEDTPEVLSIVTLSLRSAGYTVIPATDGGEVIRLVQEHKDRLDALIMDVGLPTASGVECLIRARQIVPHLPVVLMTGGAMPDLPAEEDRLLERLPKPFRTEALVERLAAVIDERARAASHG
ncbi:MAG: response regulator [Phycisphaerales bacterium]|nr:response regulator [Phycisphaerales bacterium]